jgi:hypothetical protein
MKLKKEQARNRRRKDDDDGECGSAPSASTKAGEPLYKLSDCKLLKDSTK